MWGVCSLVVFLLARIRGGPESIVYKQDYYSGRDLYKHHYVEHFREAHPAFDQPLHAPLVPYRERPEHPSLDEADVLVFGDSFANFRWLKSYPEILRDKLGRPVYFARDQYPLRLLGEQAYTAPSGRVAIFQIGERGIRTGFARAQMDFQGRAHRPKRDNAWFRLFAPGEAEQQYTALLQLSILTHRAYKWIATRKFDWFGYLSPMTPVYSLDPPILFLKQTVDGSPQSFQYQHPQHEIEQICDNIALLHDRMRRKHGLEMVFMAVPNKISIHFAYVWPDAHYNDFLPRIHQGLAQRGVPYVDLYQAFRNADERLYFLSDTHWNEHGVARAAAETIRVLEALALPAGGRHD